jgi:DNA-binding PadR family transcriptional regulator
MLARLEKRGWLRSERDPNGGTRARKDYYLTEEGHEALDIVRRQLNDLRLEVTDPAPEL